MDLPSAWDQTGRVLASDQLPAVIAALALLFTVGNAMYRYLSAGKHVTKAKHAREVAQALERIYGRDYTEIPYLYLKYKKHISTASVLMGVGYRTIVPLVVVAMSPGIVIMWRAGEYPDSSLIYTLSPILAILVMCGIVFTLMYLIIHRRKRKAENLVNTFLPEELSSFLGEIHGERDAGIGTWHAQHVAPDRRIERRRGPWPCIAWTAAWVAFAAAIGARGARR